MAEITLPALAFDPRGLALQGRQPRQRYEPLVIQILTPVSRASDQLQLLSLGRDLGIEARDLPLRVARCGLCRRSFWAVTRTRTSFELRLLGRTEDFSRRSRPGAPPFRPEFQAAQPSRSQSVAPSGPEIRRAACSHLKTGLPWVASSRSSNNRRCFTSGNHCGRGPPPQPRRLDAGWS